MPEWSFIVIFGAAGGFVNVLFLAGTDVPLSPFMAGIEKTNLYGLYLLAQNIILGGVASFAAWALVSGASFDNQGTTPIQAIGSLITGGAGVPIVNALFRQAKAKEQVSRLSDLLKDVLAAQATPTPAPSSPQPAPPQGGGSQEEE